MVKVRALLSRMRPFFTSDDFVRIERSFLAFNDRLKDVPSESGPDEGLADYLRLVAGDAAGENRAVAGFEAWSRSLFGLGNLAEGLLTFMRDFV